MRALLALTAFALTLAAVPASAQTALPGGVLTEEERTIIRDYFGKKMGDVIRNRTGQTAGDAKAPETNDEKNDDDDKDGKAGKAKKGKGHAKSNGKGKGRGKGLPPGLAKRSTLPPGLQRQLDERGALPPGLRTEALPADLEAKLPPVKDEFERVIADGSVVLIEKATQRVLDVLDGVVRGRGQGK